ncbi:ABC transporter substrate-binding protein [Tindallia magadiensis]|nr:ABC transporter substrate-binding protein [Tindallia magadiensis]
MKKVLMIVLIMVLTITSFAACSNNKQAAEDQEKATGIQEEAAEKPEEAEQISVKVAAPTGAPTLSMIRMFKEQPSFGDHVNIQYESVQSPDLMASRLLSGEVDIAVVPTNLAASLYHRGADFQLVASSVWGVLYMVGNEEIDQWEDLKGKDIHTLGRGLTPDIILRYVLSGNGIDPDQDVNLHYMGGATELAPAFTAGQIDLAVIPEPALTNILMNREDAVVLYNLQEEWSRLNEGYSSYPQASLIISRDLIDNQRAFVDAFLEEYESSIDWLFENRELAGEYSEELEVGMRKGAVVQGLERMNIEYQHASEAKPSIEAYIRVLLEAAPDTVGGKELDDNFYMEK